PLSLHDALPISRLPKARSEGECFACYDLCVGGERDARDRGSVVEDERAGGEGQVAGGDCGEAVAVGGLKFWRIRKATLNERFSFVEWLRATSCVRPEDVPRLLRVASSVLRHSAYAVPLEFVPKANRFLLVASAAGRTLMATSQ